MLSYFTRTPRKVLIGLISLMGVISAVYIAWSYSHQVRTGEITALERINTISSTLAATVDARKIERIKKNYPIHGALEKKTRDAWYYTTHILLLRTADANNLDVPIRILVKDGFGEKLQVLVSSDLELDFRGSYGPQSNVIAHYFDTGGGIDLVDTDVPRWIALSPISDSYGNTIAVVSTELPKSAIHEKALANLLWNVLFSILLTGLIIFVMVRMIGTWLLQNEQEKDLLNARNDDITQSIEYAGKIQSQLIPDPAIYSREFHDHFLINKPKERISGDFHWFKRIDEHRRLVAISDCTGHGLPGAMMVAVGCSVLNEVVDENNWENPADILSQMNTKIIRNLAQQNNKKGAGDGMDIALCMIDDRDRTVLFAGAFRPLYWSQNGKLTILNGDRQPIGGSQHAQERKFTCHKVSYSEGDRLYLFSDGYVDQFGGPDNRKFLTSRFNKLIEENQHLSLHAQAKLLENTFEQWKEGYEQVDDVCLLALELN
jgi:serine phosphatase RsbU (regulator of sigma subunit)